MTPTSIQADTIEAPASLTAKEFEQLCLIDSAWSEERSLYTMGRYGVSLTYMKNPESGQVETRALRSLPDFDGVLPPRGRQFVADAKVCSQASLMLHESHFSDRQLLHLNRRANFGAVAFLLIHFNRRVLKTRIDEAGTWAFPVHENHPFWRQFQRAELRSISRINCEEYGVEVRWHVPPRSKKARPNLLAAVLELESRKGL